MHAIGTLQHSFLASIWRYLHIVRFKISRVLVFRTEMAIWIVMSFLPFAILFLIWQELYADQNSINGYTLADITTYYLVSALLSNLTEVHFEGWRSDEIRLGQIDRFFTKPYYYLTDIVLGETVGKLLYASMFLPVFSIFIYWSAEVVGTTLPPISLITLARFLALVFVAYLMQLAIGILITFLTFWFEGAQGLEHFKLLGITILSGTLMPLEFLPDWLRTITNLLPFKFLYAVPIGVLQGRYVLESSDLFMLAATMVVLGVAVDALWRSGVRKYASSGG